MKYSRKNINILASSGVGVLATDTLYGLVGSALRTETVERIYRIKKRDLKKPLIVLISSLNDLKQFDVKPNKKQLKFLSKSWPGPISIILPCEEKKFSYLHRGTCALAFRIPKKENLLQLLRIVGPLVAPSANLEGKPPATMIKEAKNYFGDSVDFYVSEGKRIGKSSQIVLLKQNKVKIVRK